MRIVKTGRVVVTVASLGLAGALLAACSSGPSPTTTTVAPGTVAAVKAAVTGFLTGQGVQSFKYVITKAEVSSGDPTWAYFFVGPTHAHQADFQSFYGFAQKASGSWKVVASGSSEVGCPPGAPGNTVVPTAVQSEFGFTCPTTTSTAASTTTTTAATTTTTSAQTALSAAVVAFQTSQGVAQSIYQIGRLSVSTVQPTWAIFSVGPTTTSKATFQGGYGFLHLVDGNWSVTAFGSAEVGCPGSSAADQVPVAVITGFGQSCPTTGTTATTT
jgi:hypothetical protein